MSTFKITLAYDGTDFVGWQRQAEGTSIQGLLEDALAELDSAPVTVFGAGRTDAGVHALGQVAHLRVRSLPGKLPHESLRRGINDGLPSDICLLEVEDAPNTFHARHDALGRTYLYQISTRRTAFLKKYVWWVKDKLDLSAMSRASRMVIGRHNFAAFRAEDPARPKESTIVVVDSAGIDVDGDLILFRITASHFLWRMVRRIAGVLVKTGLGEIATEDVLRLLDGKIDARLDVAAWTAPSSGLFLESVSYGDASKRPQQRRMGYTQRTNL